MPAPHCLKFLVTASRWRSAAALGWLTAVLGTAALAAASAETQLRLFGVDYLPRWSQGTQHEFTPRGQEDLDHWTEMVTVNYYPDVKDGEALARTASAVVEAYKSHHAIILKTNSVPRTADRPAEHFVAAVLPSREFLEAVSARFVILDGAGVSIVSSHREYGTPAGNQMSAWLQKNGASAEAAVKAVDHLPSSVKARP